jgi:hypothetical protein
VLRADRLARDERGLLRDVLTAFKSPAALQSPAGDRGGDGARHRIAGAMQNPTAAGPSGRGQGHRLSTTRIFVDPCPAGGAEQGLHRATETLAAARDYLRNVETYYPTWYSPQVRQTLSAYALYVRS